MAFKIYTRNLMWQLKLARVMDNYFEPFAWGENDCFSQMRKAVIAVTNDDFLYSSPTLADRLGPDFTMAYKNKTAGLKVLKDAGFADFMELADLVFERITPKFAKDGHICIPANKLCIGVIHSRKCYYLNESQSGPSIEDIGRSDVTCWNIDRWALLPPRS